MNSEELKDLLSHYGKVEFTLPKDTMERARQLIGVVVMSGADGKLDGQEESLVLKIAGNLGFRTEVVPQIAKMIVEGSSLDQVESEVVSYLEST